jgi:hypothetical protein
MYGHLTAIRTFCGFGGSFASYCSVMDASAACVRGIRALVLVVDVIHSRVRTPWALRLSGAFHIAE